MTMTAMVLFYKELEYIVEYLDGQVEVIEDISLIDHYTKCIVCDNYGVSAAYAFQIVTVCIQKCVDTICYYPFSEQEKKELGVLANRYGGKIVFVNKRVDKALEIKEIDIPVIYICGEGIECDQLEFHALISNALCKKGMKVLNISNSFKASLLNFEYFDIEKIASNERGDEIKRVNEWIVGLQDEQKADVIVLSNIEGVIPLDIEDTSSYGVENHFLKYAVPFDYVVFSTYTNLIELMRMDEFSDYLSAVLNEKEIYYAISRHCYDKTNNHISIFYVNDEDYRSCLDRTKTRGHKNVMALCDLESINNFVERVVCEYGN